jgi:hypothetical protein
MAEVTPIRPGAKIELMVCREYPNVGPIVEREFKRICPTLELLDFNAAHVFHWIEFSGSEAEILRLGVVNSSMIAVRPKRRVHIPNVGRTLRRVGDRVEVHLCLNEELDRAHPLAPLAIWNWQSLLDQSEESEEEPLASTAPEWREQALGQVDFDLTYLKSWNGKIWRGKNEHLPRFQFAAEEISRMESMIHRFRKELIAAMEVAAVVDTQTAPRASHLRLVVDHEVRP